MSDERTDRDKDTDQTSGQVVLEDDADDGDDTVPLAAATDEREQKSPDRLTVPEVLPVLPIRDAVAFPGTVMPLNISRAKSKRVLDLALAGSRIIAVVAQRNADTEDPKLEDLYRVGVACVLLKLFKLDDGTQTVIVHGISRVGLVSMTEQTEYLEAKVHPRYDSRKQNTEIDALAHNVRHSARQIIDMSENIPEDARVVLDSIRAPGGLADFVSANLSLGLVHKQELLETFDVAERLRKVHLTIAGQVEVLELSRKIQSEVRTRMEKSQRDYFLREQLKAIQSELGHADARSTAVAELEEKIVAAKMPETVEAEARHELERMSGIPQASPEYSVALDHLEWMCALPWTVSTEDQADIEKASKILDQDHYGLRKVKRRILEFLAVRQLRPESRGPILCFAGPPGVGKTSLGRSIARALGRKFIRMSLGGVHDEADIRGHRRTYIGAMPGRIIREIRKAGSNNPLFMLDEVDKLGQDFRGDPAAALLEVLDPAQNSSFTDHYLDVPFDLSKVLFIATANYMDPIPPALLDRMEVLELSGYTIREKVQIAKRYLVPRQLEENGLKKSQVKFDEQALRRIVTGYTREAGVRNLERKIGAVCRSRAVAIVQRKRRSARVTTRSLTKDLGRVRFESEVAARVAMPGVVTGLAFTPTGGEILFIEATLMPGNANLNLTGQLGSVMRESSQAAFSLVRSRAEALHIDPDEVLRHDYHIHVPAGGIPKDGPSAGVAMLTVLVSALTGKTVDPRTGMTGEITLRGRVLPVGGIKEKVLAGHRAGLNRIILPETNVRDLEDVPEDVREQIEFIPVRTIDQVLDAALNGASKKPKKKRRKR